jgi:hypothetical protein
MHARIECCQVLQLSQNISIYEVFYIPYRNRDVLSRFTKQRGHEAERLSTGQRDYNRASSMAGKLSLL